MGDFRNDSELELPIYGVPEDAFKVDLAKRKDRKLIIATPEWVEKAARDLEAANWPGYNRGPVTPEEKGMTTLSYRKLVMPSDLNAANNLFGGQIMKWADEAAAMYAMCQLQSNRLVTLKVSEILFKEPVKQGDFLEFWAQVEKAGRTSLTVHLEVYRKVVAEPDVKHPPVLSCSFVFVHLDEAGKPTAHRLAPVS